MKQRQPRVFDPKYLAWLRTNPCCICGKESEACHIRSGSIEYDKPPTGMAEKPDDKWALPMCHPHHVQQHSMNEMVFWKLHKINPFRLARLYFYKGVISGNSKPSSTKPKSRTKKSQRPKPKIPSRPFEKRDKRS